MSQSPRHLTLELPMVAADEQGSELLSPRAVDDPIAPDELEHIFIRRQERGPRAALRHVETKMGGPDKLAELLGTSLKRGLAVNADLKSEYVASHGSNEPCKSEGRRNLLQMAVDATPVWLMSVIVSATIAGSLDVHGGIATLVISLPVLVTIVAIERYIELSCDADPPTSTVRVIRSKPTEASVAYQVRVSTADIFVGDLVELHPGDAVPADAMLVSIIGPGSTLSLDESSLTGEPTLVTKSLADDPFLFGGTFVHAGTGRCIVMAVGLRSAAGAAAFDSADEVIGKRALCLPRRRSVSDRVWQSTSVCQARRRRSAWQRAAAVTLVVSFTTLVIRVAIASRTTPPRLAPLPYLLGQLAAAAAAYPVWSLAALPRAVATTSLCLSARFARRHHLLSRWTDFPLSLASLTVLLLPLSMVPTAKELDDERRAELALGADAATDNNNDDHDDARMDGAAVGIGSSTGAVDWAPHGPHEADRHLRRMLEETASLGVSTIFFGGAGKVDEDARANRAVETFGCAVLSSPSLSADARARAARSFVAAASQLVEPPASLLTVGDDHALVPLLTISPLSLSLSVPPPARALGDTGPGCADTLLAAADAAALDGPVSLSAALPAALRAARHATLVVPTLASLNCSLALSSATLVGGGWLLLGQSLLPPPVVVLFAATMLLAVPLLLAARPPTDTPLGHDHPLFPPLALLTTTPTSTTPPRRKTSSRSRSPGRSNSSRLSHCSAAFAISLVHPVGCMLGSLLLLLAPELLALPPLAPLLVGPLNDHGTVDARLTATATALLTTHLVGQLLALAPSAASACLSACLAVLVALAVLLPLPPAALSLATPPPATAIFLALSLLTSYLTAVPRCTARSGTPGRPRSTRRAASSRSPTTSSRSPGPSTRPSSTNLPPALASLVESTLLTIRRKGRRRSSVRERDRDSREPWSSHYQPVVATTATLISSTHASLLDTGERGQGAAEEKERVDKSVEEGGNVVAVEGEGQVRRRRRKKRKVPGNH